jgi:hypothetical protein
VSTQFLRDRYAELDRGWRACLLAALLVAGAVLVTTV